MIKTHYVNCPFCAGLMEVDSETGDVVNKWAKAERDVSGGDKIQNALQKLGDAKKNRETLFDKKKNELEGQKKKIEQSFREEIEKAKREGPAKKPFTPFDLD
jgi:hypothetical protein